MEKQDYSGAEWLHKTWSRRAGCFINVYPDRVTPDVGNGLFTAVEIGSGDHVFEETPICGTVTYNESIPGERCSHCASLLLTNSLRCLHGCGTLFCCDGCMREATFAHHGSLCSALPGGESWVAYQDQCLKLRNDYYIIAARMFASLRHLKKGDVVELPWEDYAGRLWWDCLKRPGYFDAVDSFDGEDAKEKKAQAIQRRDVIFRALVQNQTEEMLERLQAIFRAQGLFEESDLLFQLLNLNNFARTLGIIRSNVLSIGSCRDSIDVEKKQGLAGYLEGAALYRIQSLLNHSCSPNCKMGLSRSTDGNCVLEALCDIPKGRELRIDYLAGAELTPGGRRNALKSQYSIECTCEVCSAAN